MSDQFDDTPRAPAPEQRQPDDSALPRRVLKGAIFVFLAFGAFWAMVGSALLFETNPGPGIIALAQILVLIAAGVRIARTREWGTIGSTIAIMLLVNALLFGLCLTGL